ncbi:MAG: type II secretion system F family protein [Panacagrimonas sp.]
MIAAIVIFSLAVLMAGFAIWLFVYADRRERSDEMMERLGASDEPRMPKYRSRESQLGNPVLRSACHLIWRTGSDMQPQTVTRILLVLVALVPLALFLFGWMVGTGVVLGGLVLGLLVLRNRAARRRARIGEQLPGFLEAAMRVLQAGNTMEESISAAAQESVDPLRPLFLSVGRKVRLGAPLDQVLVEMADIHNIRNLKVIALAASINRKYGGSLRNMFRSLIGAIRARESAAREMRALTAETRISAIVLAVIPIGLSIYIYLRNRLYYVDMWESPNGRFALIMAVVLQVTGVVVIYRMMTATQDNS